MFPVSLLPMSSVHTEAAILGNAELATVNGSDFQPFVPHGLKLLAES